MYLRVIVCLSLLAFVVGHDVSIDEEHQKVMIRCTKESNVSDEEIHEFAKELKDPTPEIKNFFLCVTQGMGTFDGTNWNREQIRKIVKDEEKMKYVDECLAKDDKNLEPRERNFAVVKCALEKESFM